MTGLWVAAVAVAVGLAFGGFRTLTDGRFRGTRSISGVDAPSTAGLDDSAEMPVAGHATRADDQVETSQPTWSRLGTAVGDTALGERATLVQFSSAFCAPCRVTRRVLSEVADVVPGVVHLEIDAEHHLEAVRRLGILRTPTTLVLDAAGREVARAAGAPRKDQVLAALPTGGLA